MTCSVLATSINNQEGILILAHQDCDTLNGTRSVPTVTTRYDHYTVMTLTEIIP